MPTLMLFILRSLAPAASRASPSPRGRCRARPPGDGFVLPEEDHLPGLESEGRRPRFDEAPNRSQADSREVDPRVLIRPGDLDHDRPGPGQIARPEDGQIGPLDALEGDDLAVLDDDGLADVQVGQGPGDRETALDIRQDGRRRPRPSQDPGREEPVREEGRGVQDADPLPLEERDQAPDQPGRAPPPGRLEDAAGGGVESPGAEHGLRTDLARDEDLRDPPALQEGEKAAEVSGSEPGGVGDLVPEGVLGLAADRRHDRFEAPPTRFSDGEEGKFPGAGDYSDSLSHFSDAFLMIPRRGRPDEAEELVPVLPGGEGRLDPFERLGRVEVGNRTGS